MTYGFFHWTAFLIHPVYEWTNILYILCLYRPTTSVPCPLAIFSPFPSFQSERRKSKGESKQVDHFQKRKTRVKSEKGKNKGENEHTVSSALIYLTTYILQLCKYSTQLWGLSLGLAWPGLDLFFLLLWYIFCWAGLVMTIRWMLMAVVPLPLLLLIPLFYPWVMPTPEKQRSFSLSLPPSLHYFTPSPDFSPLQNEKLMAVTRETIQLEVVLEKWDLSTKNNIPCYYYWTYMNFFIFLKFQLTNCRCSFQH